MESAGTTTIHAQVKAKVVVSAPTASLLGDQPRIPRNLHQDADP